MKKTLLLLGLLTLFFTHADAVAYFDSYRLAKDTIVSLGSTAYLEAKFCRSGVLGYKDIQGKKAVLQFFKSHNQSWTQLTSGITDSDGRVKFSLPSVFLKEPGVYFYKISLDGDDKSAEGSIYVLRPGQKVVITDVDGTLTTGDDQLIKGRDATMYDDANALMYAHAKNDVLVIYLTGRPYLLKEMTRAWLVQQNFPPGPLLTTDYISHTLPSEQSVGVFKLNFIRDLMNLTGVEIVAAYGNALTDISAYSRAGIPMSKVFIIGPHAGEQPCEGYLYPRPVTSYSKIL